MPIASTVQSKAGLYDLKGPEDPRILHLPARTPSQAGQVMPTLGAELQVPLKTDGDGAV